MAYSFIDTLFANGDDMDPSPFWVLMALCWFVNEKKATGTTGACWPSIKKIAAKAHVSELTARKSIKVLMEKKFITAHQPPGKVRVFYVDFSRIKELAGGKDLEGVKDVSGVKDLEGGPLKMLKGRGERSLPPPLKDLEAEQGNNKEENKEANSTSMRTSGKTSAIAVASAQAQTPYPDDFDKSLFEEAEREARSFPEPLPDPPALPPIEPPAPAPQKRKAAPRRRPATPCPFDADASIPDEYKAIAEKVGIGNPQQVFSAFVNHALATDRRLTVWPAGFRTWCLNELRYHPLQTAKPKPLHQRTADDYNW